MLLIPAVKSLDNLEYLRAHYNLSGVINPRVHVMERHGLVEHAIISPIFGRSTNYFVREIHRLSQFDLLYYKLYPNDEKKIFYGKPLVHLLSNMTHIMPRKQIEYDVDVLRENGKDSQVK